MVLLFVLHRSEKWSLALREEDKLQVSENKVINKICGHKEDVINQKFRVLQND